MEKTTKTKVLLWITPRSCSTALELMISQIDKCHVIHEPFATVSWEDRLPLRETNKTKADANRDVEATLKKESAYEANFCENSIRNGNENEETETFEYDFENKNSTVAINKAFDTLCRAYPLSKYLFSKDCARGALHHKHVFLEERFRGFKHVFLVRHPQPAVISHYKLFKEKHLGLEYFDGDFVSYRHIYAMLQFVKENIDPKPAVFRTEDLQVDPKNFMQKFCSEVGFPYNDSLLSWPDKSYVCNQFVAKWYEFHRKAAESGSFRALDKNAVMKFDNLDKHTPVVRDAITYNLEYYNLIKADFIKLGDF